MKVLFGIFTLLVLILSGLLLTFAHPFRMNDLIRENSWWTVLVASLGLGLFIYLSTNAKTFGARFWRGFLGGFAFFALALHWILNALQIFGGIQAWLSYLIGALLAAYCAAFYGFWSAIAGSQRFIDQSPWVKAMAWASLWTSLEALRQWLFTGFGWGELGYQFHFVPWVRESASIWGVHGLTFFWVFWITLILDFDHILESRSEKIRALATFILMLLVMGGARLSLSFYEAPESLRVSLLQPNIPQEEKWSATSSTGIVQKLLAMTEKSIQEGTDLIIWPETAYPRLVGAQQRQLPFSTSVPLVMGAVVRDGQINRNSALMVEKDQILERFDKEHLVPFGEFVPFAKYVPFGKLVANVGDFEPGAKDQPLLKVPGRNLRLGPLICYEDVFSRSSARLAKQGAQILVNMTNDAWYGVSSAQSQHAAMSALQTYQTFLPMVRSTNNGMTSVITPLRRSDQPNFVDALVTESVPYSANPKKTFFVWTYPLMEWIWILIFVLMAFAPGDLRSKRIFFRK